MVMHRRADADTDTDLAPDLPVLFNYTHVALQALRLLLLRRLPGYAVNDIRLIVCTLRGLHRI